MRYLVILLFFLSSSCRPPANQQRFQAFADQYGYEVDLWIREGRVFSPDLRFEFTDLLIDDGKIVYRGWVDSTVLKPSRTIKANGAVVAPGFIDPHAHGNPLQTPEFNNFLAMGVTTIFLGQDGSSPLYDTLALWMDQVDKAKADFTSPHRLAEGFQYVLVNGAVVMESGEKKEEGHGRLLRKI